MELWGLFANTPDNLVLMHSFKFPNFISILENCLDL